MDLLPEWVTNYWVQFGVGYLLVLKIVTAIRDAIDSTPETDDNWFERGVTLLKKSSQYLILGKRSK